MILSMLSFVSYTIIISYSSFSPTDTKLATCSEDGTVRTFDFIRCAEEFILRGVCVCMYNHSTL